VEVFAATVPKEQKLWVPIGSGWNRADGEALSAIEVRSGSLLRILENVGRTMAEYKQMLYFFQCGR